MNFKIILLISLAFAISVATNSQVISKTEPSKKVALVIGNGNYMLGTLANPENDAKLIADVLKKLEFDVMFYANLDWRSMKKSLDDFRAKLKGADVALFYYAGHGVQVGGYNFLIPVDANPQSESQVEYDCIPADRILSDMTDSGAKIKIMILDACRNNPFEKRWSNPSSSRGLAVMRASSRSNNTFIAYSTAPGSTALDGSGKNSPYTTALAEAMVIPDIKINDMFTIVAKNVSQRTGGEQNPWKSDSMVEDFYFNPQSMISSAEGLDYFYDARDKNNYQILKTNSQVWTKRNLNYVSFNNGDSIPVISDPEQLRLLNMPVILWSPQFRNAGKLYNYYTVTDVRNICPAGWHIPTSEEWKILANETGLKLKSLDGDKLNMETEVMNQPQVRNVIKPSGVSALPSRLREEIMEFVGQGSDRGFFASDGYVITISADSVKIDSLLDMSDARSIRCVKGRSPIAATDSSSDILATSAVVYGRVNPNLAYTFVSFEYGLTKDYGQSVDAEEISVTGSVPSVVTAKISGLTPGSVYHYRVRAENNAGTSYGEDRTFTTLVPPFASTQPATSISSSEATLNALVNANNTVTEVSFEYGLTPEYGNIVTATGNPFTGNEKVLVNCTIKGLSENTVYHYRVKAVSKAGTTFGNDMTLTTLKLPVVKAEVPAAVKSYSAVLRGTINSSNLPTDISFEYGTGEDYDRSIKGSETPMQSNKDEPISISLDSLMPGTEYHYRIKAYNIAGTSFSNDMTFTTPEVVTDVEGNSYVTLIIGDQIWMAENLRTTKFADGTVIPEVKGKNAWKNRMKAAYCWYDNDTSYRKVTGALYNWYTVMATNMLCPKGWHVPTRSEWDILLNSMGGYEKAGSKLKERGTAHWQDPNRDATDESGFTALPGGVRNIGGLFSYYGIKGQWWTSDDTVKNLAWYQAMDFNNTAVNRFFTVKSEGMSIRCVKYKIPEVKSPPPDSVINPPPVVEEPVYFVDPRDNRQYQIVKIGKQVWMAENLVATKFNDGTEIPEVVDKIEWTRLVTPAYCWYDNHEAYSKYGALYNWQAVSSGKLCPVGWHVPTYEEWEELFNTLGGKAIAGGTLKESGTAHWDKPNMSSGYISRFAALPGGYRNEYGDFSDIGKKGFWWSYTRNKKPAGWYQVMYNSNTSVVTRNFQDKPVGFSVRCVKD
ncbi:MAG TPA: FISUMP domain-containing protein [Bacteroidales bacterium]|nr:FISUMP domain-containing protein [Bacteroidales bacterium]